MASLYSFSSLSTVEQHICCFSVIVHLLLLVILQSHPHKNNDIYIYTYSTHFRCPLLFSPYFFTDHSFISLWNKYIENIFIILYELLQLVHDRQELHTLFWILLAEVLASYVSRPRIPSILRKVEKPS